MHLKAPSIVYKCLYGISRSFYKKSQQQEEQEQEQEQEQQQQQQQQLLNY